MAEIPNEAKVMATIGGVCLQMSLLEYGIAGVIWAFLALDEDTGAIVTGGLDILPRINMAINLAEHKRAPVTMRAELRRIRKELQDGLLDRRNQAVHGAHLLSGVEPSTTIKMHRWPHPKRIATVTATELFELSKAFHALSLAVDQVWADFGTWRFGPQGGNQDAQDHSGGWLTRFRLKLAKLIHPGV